MPRLLILFAMFFTLQTSAQHAYLFVKKKGKKVRTYLEGSFIMFRTDGQTLSGYITRLRNDTVYINGHPFAATSIARIVLPKKRSDLTPANFLLTTGGVALSTAGMAASGWETFENALFNSAVIGYSPWALSLIKKSMKRRGYRLGKKFRLQVFDLRPY